MSNRSSGSRAGHANRRVPMPEPQPDSPRFVAWARGQQYDYEIARRKYRDDNPLIDPKRLAQGQ